MIYIKPCFFDKFKCKADKCTDTCCAGWEVDIDAETYEKYKSVGGAFGKRLTENIVSVDGQPTFRLCESDRCAFLAKDGLCDIYSQLGEEYLCEICREHPRFYDFFDGITEMGLGLCCEKVCEMIFSSDAPVTFETCCDEYDDDTAEDEQVYFLVREKCFDILYDRKKPLNARVQDLIDYSVSVQNSLFSDNYISDSDKDFKNICLSVIKLFSETEPINNDWSDYVQSLEREFENILSVRIDLNVNEYEYEQILTYILYRHFMQSRFSGNILSSIGFAVVSIIFIYLCDCKTFFETKEYSLADRINNVKLWSKQIEYSEENTQILLEKSVDILFCMS